MGTALTEQQIDAIARLAPKALFCQDPDRAGQESVATRDRGAARRTTPSRTTRGVEFRIVRLPAGPGPGGRRRRRRAPRRCAGCSRRPWRSSASRSSARWSSRTRAADEMLAASRRSSRRCRRACCATSWSSSSPTGSGIGRALVNEALRGAGRRLAPRARLERRGRRGATVATADRRDGDATTVGARGGGRDRVTGVPATAAARAGRPARGARPPRAERAARSSPTASRCPRRASSGWPPSTSTTTSPRPRRARPRRYLRGRLRSPTRDLPAGDEDLARLVAELVVQSAALEATPAKLELEALQLELHRLERHISRPGSPAPRGRPRARRRAPEECSTRSAIS